MTTTSARRERRVQVSGSHTYAEEGKYTATITLRDIDNPANFVTVQSAVTISDAPLPDIEVGTLVATAGVPIPKGTFVARFQDANQGAPVADFLALVDYGDGNGPVPATVLSLGGGGFEVDTANPVTYPGPGTFPITVDVIDVGGNAVTGNNDADVARGAPPLPLDSSGIPCRASRARSSIRSSRPSSSATRTPCPRITVATIDWDDGSTTLGAISLIGGTNTTAVFQITGEHVYSEEGILPGLDHRRRLEGPIPSSGTRRSR